MAEYDSIIATAKRLIEKKGRAVQFVPPSSIDVNALKPWLGKQDGLGVPGFAAFTKDERSEDEGAQRRIGEVFVAADPAYNLTTEWEVVDTATTWEITKADLIAPGAQQVVWRLDLAAAKT